MHDKTLSTYAHNVKIVSQDGHVTLKGPVRSDEEVKSVEAAATKVAGAGHVSNELTVASRTRQVDQRVVGNHRPIQETEHFMADKKTSVFGIYPSALAGRTGR